MEWESSWIPHNPDFFGMSSRCRSCHNPPQKKVSFGYYTYSAWCCCLLESTYSTRYSIWLHSWINYMHLKICKENKSYMEIYGIPFQGLQLVWRLCCILMVCLLHQKWVLGRWGAWLTWLRLALKGVVVDRRFWSVFSDYYPAGWMISLHIHDAVEQSLVYVPIMDFHKFVSIHLFVNESFWCDTTEG